MPDRKNQDNSLLCALIAGLVDEGVVEYATSFTRHPLDALHLAYTQPALLWNYERQVDG